MAGSRTGNESGENANSDKQALTPEAICALGAIVMTAFGALWLIGWCSEAFEANVLPLGTILVLGIGIGAYGVWDLRRRPRIPLAAEIAVRNRRIRSIFKWVNVIQWSLILVLAVFLDHIGLGRWTEAAIVLIVGLHFVPLAAVLRVKTYYVTACALVLLALAYPFFARQGPESPVGALGTGVILWLTALTILVLNPPPPGD